MSSAMRRLEQLMGECSYQEGRSRPVARKLLSLLRALDLPTSGNRLLSVPDREIALAAGALDHWSAEMLIVCIPGRKQQRVRDEQALLRARRVPAGECAFALERVIARLEGRSVGTPTSYLRPTNRRVTR